MLKNRIYHLSNCSTCKRILSELPTPSFTLIDIKSEPISEKALDEMAAKTGSYESLFSRRALKYKELGLAKKKLTEKEYKKYILSDYTFLKRPVVWIGQELFVGNAKKTIENINAILKKKKYI